MEQLRRKVAREPQKRPTWLGDFRGAEAVAPLPDPSALKGELSLVCCDSPVGGWLRVRFPDSPLPNKAPESEPVRVFYSSPFLQVLTNQTCGDLGNRG